MRILSLDSSSKCTGWSVLTVMPERRLRLDACGEIKLSHLTKDTDKLMFLFNEVCGLLRKYEPNRIGIENIYRGPNSNTFKVLAEYRGVCILAMAHEGYDEYATFTASEVRKRAFGEGNLKKDAVCAALSAYFGRDLATKGMDQSDAVAVAVATSNVSVPLVDPPPKVKPKRSSPKPKTRRKKAS